MKLAYTINLYPPYRYQTFVGTKDILDVMMISSCITYLTSIVFSFAENEREHPRPRLKWWLRFKIMGWIKAVFWTRVVHPRLRIEI